MDFNLDCYLDMDLGDLAELSAAFEWESSSPSGTQSVNDNPTEQTGYHTFKAPLLGRPKLESFAFSK